MWLVEKEAPQHWSNTIKFTVSVLYPPRFPQAERSVKIAAYSLTVDRRIMEVRASGTEPLIYELLPENHLLAYKRGAIVASGKLSPGEYPLTLVAKDPWGLEANMSVVVIAVAPGLSTTQKLMTTGSFDSGVDSGV